MAVELTKLLSYLGHRRITLRADPEGSCTALANAVQALRHRIGMETHIEQTPVGEHQGNHAEGAIERIRQLAGTMLSELEGRLNIKIKTFDPLHHWCWRHASWTLQRFGVTQNLTPWERVHASPYGGKLVRFAECVLARVKTATKGKPRWLRAMWLGKSDVSDCHLVCTSSGRLVVARSVRRTTCEYDPSLLPALRDTPDKHVSFLAGRVGASRNQLAPKPVTEEGPGSESEVAASDPPTENEDVFDNPHDIALAPSSVRLPADGMPATPDYRPPAQEPSQPSRLPPRSAPPESALATGEPKPCQALTPNPSLGVGLNPGQPTTPVDEIGGLEGLDSAMAELEQVHERAEFDGDVQEAKRQRIRAVNSHHHNDEVVHLEDLGLGSDTDLNESVEDPPAWNATDNFEDAKNIPEELWRPFGAGEPQLSSEELAHIDDIAEAFELARLETMNVLERLPATADFSGFKRLSTKMVKTWRVKPSPKGGGEAFLRRARFVAREFRWLSAMVDNEVFAPASSNALLRVLPAALVARQPEGWTALSLDVADAYLTVPQAVDTIVTIWVRGEQRYKLLRNLPGQRSGAKDWFQAFQAHLIKEMAIEPLVEAPPFLEVQMRAMAGEAGVFATLMIFLQTGPIRPCRDSVSV